MAEEDFTLADVVNLINDNERRVNAKFEAIRAQVI